MQGDAQLGSRQVLGGGRPRQDLREHMLMIIKC